MLNIKESNDIKYVIINKHNEIEKEVIKKNKRTIVNNKIGAGIVSSKAITLISLVVTIIILIILAGVVINLSLGQNGIFTKAKQAKEKYGKAEAREKLETVLVEAAIEKRTSGDYDLDNMLEKKDMTVNGDNVIVDNYNF